MDSFDFTDRRNIIHVTENNLKDGNPIPAIYVDGSLKSIVIKSTFQKEEIFIHSIKLGQSYKIVVSQDRFGDKFFFHVHVDGQQIYEMENDKQKYLTKRWLWYSDPWSESIAGVGSIRRLRVSTKASCKYIHMLLRSLIKESSKSSIN